MLIEWLKEFFFGEMMEPIGPNLNLNQNQGVPIEKVKNAKAEEEAQNAAEKCLNNFIESLFKEKTAQNIAISIFERLKDWKDYFVSLFYPTSQISGKNYFDELPPELMRIIAKDSHLTPKNLAQLSAASKALNTSEALAEGKASIIGAEEYKRLLNVEVEDLPIPRGLMEYLKSPSVIDPKVPTMAKTMVILIPKTMKTEDDEVPKPTTLKSYREIIEKVMKEKFGSKFNGYIDDQILEQYGDSEIKESFYLVMTTKILPGTRSQPYPKQLEIAQKYGYEAPSLLPAFIGITMRVLKAGVTRYGQDGQDLLMYTHCKEVIAGYQTVVGWVGASGFHVNSSNFVCYWLTGLAGVRPRSFF